MELPHISHYYVYEIFEQELWSYEHFTSYLHILSLLYISYDNVDKNTSMETFVTDLVVDWQMPFGS